MVLLGTFSGISVVDVLFAASMGGTAAVVVVVAAVVVATGSSETLAATGSTATTGRATTAAAGAAVAVVVVVAMLDSAGAALIAFTTGGVAGAAVVEAALTFVSFNPNQRSCPATRFVATAACTKLLGNPWKRVMVNVVQYTNLMVSSWCSRPKKELVPTSLGVNR
jgi:hypothetical protein